MYHQLCQAVSQRKEILVVFCDISKAFDRVWHRGLLLKLQRNGISGSLLAWLTDYLSNRSQSVLINGQCSAWLSILAGVPQGSVLGPLLFLIFINDITYCVRHCQIRLFADDTSLFIEVDNRQDAALKIDEDLEAISQWAKKWLVQFSPPKTDFQDKTLGRTPTTSHGRGKANGSGSSQTCRCHYQSRLVLA